MQNNNLSITEVDEKPMNDTELNHLPIPTCRCGCIPTNMKSLFEMAALRAEYRKRQLNSKSHGQNSEFGSDSEKKVA